MIERVCIYCGNKFMARGNNAKCCGSDECRRADRERRKENMRKWMRRKRASTPKPSHKSRTCEVCGAPVGDKFRFCEPCRAKRKKEQNLLHNATPRIKGGDGSGKWRDGWYARKRSTLGARMIDAEIVAGSCVPYLDPATTRVEWRH